MSLTTSEIVTGLTCAAARCLLFQRLCLVVQVVQASRWQLSPSHSCRRRVQVGASRRLRAQLGRHAVRGWDMEWQYELLLMAINGY